MGCSLPATATKLRYHYATGDVPQGIMKHHVAEACARLHSERAIGGGLMGTSKLRSCVASKTRSPLWVLRVLLGLLLGLALCIRGNYLYRMTSAISMTR